MIKSLRLITLGLTTWPGWVWAHHAMGGDLPVTAWQGLASGLAHPVIGLDHLVFLLLIGILAGTRSRVQGLVMGCGFVGGTVIGTVIHLGGLEVVAIESIIAATLVAAGALMWLRQRPGIAFLGTAILLAGAFHGYAYGEAIVGAETSPLAAYLLGFSLIQWVLIGFTASLTPVVLRALGTKPVAAERAFGTAVALSGLVFLGMAA